MMQTHTVEVRLLGQRMVVKSQEDPALVQEVVEFASQRIKEAEKRANGAASHQIALLALLDLSEEYLKARRRALEHKQEINDKSLELLGLIETELK